MISLDRTREAFGLHGLSASQVEPSRLQHGRNVLTPPRRVPLWLQFLKKFDDPIIKILLVAVAISLLVSVVRGSGYIDTLVIALAIALATVVAFASEHRSNQEFEALNAERQRTRVKVVRDGHPQLVEARHLVVGDLVLLEVGDGVPADGWVTSADSLAVDESLLTGESEPVEKGQGEPVYRGSHVGTGQGSMVVAAVGDATKMGQLAGELGGRRLPTPLEQRLTNLAQMISRIGYWGGGLIALVLFLQGIHRGQVTGLNLATANHVVQYFMMAVVIIVVAVPEGLPMSVTLSLVLAMRKLTKVNALVRRMVACETMGSVTTICTDKTGTLTKNQMEVAASSVTLPQSFSARPTGAADWVALNAAVNSTAHLDAREGKLIVIGNSTEGALLRWLAGANLDYEDVRQDRPAVRQMLFTGERKRMSTIVSLGERRWLLTKGAPEVVAGLCAMPVDLTEVSALAARAMRTLAFAHRELTSDDEGEHDLIWDGFVGIRDQIRDDVPQAVADCRTARIKVRMVTGDNLETAKAIAQEIGILEGGLALTGSEFRALGEAELARVVPDLEVLARAEPSDKLRLVRALQAAEQVVAVTGDGTNDAPALKHADVGLSMGKSGTEVAREASDIVLLDDGFPTITRAVVWGRALHENIQRFLQFQLTVNLGALLISFLAPILGFSAPFTVVQLLWVNIVMDTLAALALCSEQPHAGLLEKPPLPRRQSMVTPSMVRAVVVTGLFYTVAALAHLYTGFLGGATPAERNTVLFAAFVLAQVWNGINCRALDGHMPPFFRGNPTFFAVMSVVVVVQVLVVQFGGHTFGTVPLPPLLWMRVVTYSLTVLLIGWVLRLTAPRAVDVRASR